MHPASSSTAGAVDGSDPTVAGPTTLTVRLFAAAKAAIGAAELPWPEPAPATVGDLAAALAAAHPPAAAVLARCSYIVDGIATTDPATPLTGARLVDVLPPFTGG